MSAPRLFLNAPLAPEAALALNADQARYLVSVLRLQVGDRVRVFNGADGEWEARMERADKRGAVLQVVRCLRPMQHSRALTLLFAPVKRQGSDLIIEKATELGATRLWPIITARTIAQTVRIERFEAIAREAAEQSERLDAPEILPPAPLARALDGWPADAPLLFADETQGEEAGAPLLTVLAGLPGAAPLALLIGPEGGFTPEERRVLCAALGVQPFSLGPRILRAETAAIAALAVVQAARDVTSA